MKRYAVIGASSGTGLAIVRELASKGIPVRAISRRPLPAEKGVEAFAADVTDPVSIAKALDGDFDAVFYTVDIHGLGNSRDKVRAVMYQGSVNAIETLQKKQKKPRFIMLSVIGADKFSWVWCLLNAAKLGMQKNILDREKVLKESGLDYVICRAPKLKDEAGGQHRLGATAPQHRLNMKMGIARSDLGTAMIKAAVAAPASSSWDVFQDDGATSTVSTSLAWLL